MEELVAIAKIMKPRGLRGEVAADILTDFPQRFEGLENVIGVFADGTRTDLKIEDFWFQKDRIVLRFDGIASVEAAADAKRRRDMYPGIVGHETRRGGVLRLAAGGMRSGNDRRRNGRHCAGADAYRRNGNTRRRRWSTRISDPVCGIDLHRS